MPLPLTLSLPLSSLPIMESADAFAPAAAEEENTRYQDIINPLPNFCHYYFRVALPLPLSLPLPLRLLKKKIEDIKI